MTRISGQGQLSLDFREPPMPQPGACEFEESTYKTKSRCVFHGHLVFTNCREVGHCVWDGWHQQGAPDVIRADEDG